MQSSVKLYGIANCDTIKKAKTWLKDHHIDFEFHDYRKQGLEPEQLQSWIDNLGWQALLNRRGSSWRKLPDEVKNTLDQTLALQTMLDNPAIIKRPLLCRSGALHLGFSSAEYDTIFA